MRMSFPTAILLLAGAAAPALAQRLPSTIHPTHYDLAFDVDIPHARFTGAETIRVEVADATTRIVLNAADLQISSVTVGRGDASQHATVTMDAARQQATFTVPRPLARGPAEI